MGAHMTTENKPEATPEAVPDPEEAHDKMPQEGSKIDPKKYSETYPKTVAVEEPNEVTEAPKQTVEDTVKHTKDTDVNNTTEAPKKTGPKESKDPEKNIISKKTKADKKEKTKKVSKLNKTSEKSTETPEKIAEEPSKKTDEKGPDQTKKTDTRAATKTFKMDASDKSTEASKKTAEQASKKAVEGAPQKAKESATNKTKETPKNANEPPLWHPCPPAGLKTTTRFDRLPNVKPLELLFSRLPRPQDDLDVSWEPADRAKFDKNFAFVLWGYANSDRETVIALSKDPHAGRVWDIARDAFTLDDPADLNKVRNYFLQGFATLVLDKNSSIDSRPASDADGKTLWAVWCAWVARGRSDGDSLGIARESGHTDRNELNAIKAWNCSSCDCCIRGRVQYCSGCFHPSFKQMTAIRYCGKDCQDWEWQTHKEVCSRRRMFFRGCEMFLRLAHDFEVGTWSRSNRPIVSVAAAAAKKNLPVCEENGSLNLPTNIASCAEAGSNTAHGIIGNIHMGRLAWDQPDTYAVLSPLISNIFMGKHHSSLSPSFRAADHLHTGFCDQLSIVKVYIRNARDLMIRGPDVDIKPGVSRVTLTKQPMFHPHSVLYLRLKGGEEFIVDLHGDMYGFSTDVIPFKVFIRSRAASIISIEDATEPGHENWIPQSLREIQQSRHLAMGAFVKQCRELIRKESGSKDTISSIFGVCNRKAEVYEDMRDKVFDLMEKMMAKLIENVTASLAKSAAR